MTPDMTVMQAVFRGLDLLTCPDINRRPGKALARVMGLALVALCLQVVFMADAEAGGGADKSTEYFESLADLPIAPGLAEERDEAMVFDKPDGRIVEVVASGRTPVAGVEKFYTSVLPALGWTLASKNRDGRGVKLGFEREGENLLLTIGTRQGDEITRLVVELSPE